MAQSETIGKLATALAVAQSEIGAAEKDSKNPFYKSSYASLKAVTAAVKGPLAENGLSYVQAPERLENDGRVILRTVLLHVSGEWIDSTLAMVPKDSGPQAFGSCLTYARRYALQSMLGVPTEDDDGNAAAHNNPKPPPPRDSTYAEERTAAGNNPDLGDECPAAFTKIVTDILDVWIRADPKQFESWEIGDAWAQVQEIAGDTPITGEYLQRILQTSKLKAQRKES
jgi:hypothetical protein